MWWAFMKSVYYICSCFKNRHVMQNNIKTSKECLKGNCTFLQLFCTYMFLEELIFVLSTLFCTYRNMPSSLRKSFLCVGLSCYTVWSLSKVMITVKILSKRVYTLPDTCLVIQLEGSRCQLAERHYFLLHISPQKIMP